MQNDVQFDQQGQLQHFLTINGLSQQQLLDILSTAESFISVGERAVKKVPLLRGKIVATLFFEASTRTRVSFELAAKRLSADVLNVNISTSSASKGESLMDTLNTLQAMSCDMFIVRHSDSGSAHFIAQHVEEGVSVINAGDGWHSHPTQAMLDMLTIQQHKGDFSKLSVAIVGDILHSRVARSQITALNILGVKDVRVVAPKTLLPNHIEEMGCKVYNTMEAGLKDVDVVMMLRLQTERMNSGLLPSQQEYYSCYGLTEDKFSYAKPDAIVMHPGPFNRGVEISSEIADGDRSVIWTQVSNGVAVRMAIMSIVMANRSKRAQP